MCFVAIRHGYGEIPIAAKALYGSATCCGRAPVTTWLPREEQPELTRETRESCRSLDLRVHVSRVSADDTDNMPLLQSFVSTKDIREKKTLSQPGRERASMLGD